MVAALVRQAGGELLAQQAERLPDRGELFRRGLKEVHVLRQRAAQGPGDGPGAPVGDKPPPDLALHLQPHAVNPAAVLIGGELVVHRTQAGRGGVRQQRPSNVSRSSLVSVLYM